MVGRASEGAVCPQATHWLLLPQGRGAWHCAQSNASPATGRQGDTAKRQGSTAVCVCVCVCVLPTNRSNFKPHCLSLSFPLCLVCVCMQISYSLFPSLHFVLQTNTRLKQIEKEYSQKLAKSAQLIAELQTSVCGAKEEGLRQQQEKERQLNEATARWDDERRQMSRHTDTKNKVLQEKVENLQRQLHSSEKKLLNKELENQEQVTDSLFSPSTSPPHPPDSILNFTPSPLRLTPQLHPLTPQTQILNFTPSPLILTPQLHPLTPQTHPSTSPPHPSDSPLNFTPSPLRLNPQLHPLTPQTHPSTSPPHPSPPRLNPQLHPLTPQTHPSTSPPHPPDSILNFTPSPLILTPQLHPLTPQTHPSTSPPHPSPSTSPPHPPDSILNFTPSPLRLTPQLHPLTPQTHPSTSPPHPSDSPLNFTPSPLRLNPQLYPLTPQTHPSTSPPHPQTQTSTSPLNFTPRLAPQSSTS
uniref:Uncharacterized protein n=1 Tax=Oncorhynchus kisutch TaxID=8019 RepID=A0A8C7J3D9_ONCKI